MRAILIFLFFGCFLHSLTAQKIISSFDIAPSLFIATGKEIRKVYSAGTGIGIQSTISCLRSTISFQPALSFHYFGNHYSAAVRDNLIMFNFGGNILYNYRISSKCYLSPLVGVFYSCGQDYLSPRQGYVGESIKLLKFKGPAFNIGACISLGKFFFEMDYVLSSVNATIDEVLLNAFQEQYRVNSDVYEVIEVQETKMSFNRICLKVGYRIRLKND